VTGALAAHSRTALGPHESYCKALKFQNRVEFGLPLWQLSLPFVDMVKADLTRDYYADLELQPGASDIEIKKQFRALGLTSPPLL
jgi:hypothetical protein